MLFAHVFMTKNWDYDEENEDEAPLRDERDVIWWESVNVLKMESWRRGRRKN